MTLDPAVPAKALTFTHQRVKRLRRLIRKSATRVAEGAFVLEGATLLTEALDAGAPVESVYVAAGADETVAARAGEAGLRVFTLAPGVLERVSGVVTPQPVMAVCGKVDVALECVAGSTLLLVCVDVRDPGNLGTVLRSAEAAGASGVVCCDGSADVYNPKCVRASAGSIFHSQIVAGGKPLDVLATLRDWGLRRLGSSPVGGTSLYEADLRTPVALVLGNEAQGLPASLEAELDGWLTVPMAGRTESLNVGVTAAVMCFEAARQRSS